MKLLTLFFFFSISIVPLIAQALNDESSTQTTKFFGTRLETAVDVKHYSSYTGNINFSRQEISTVHLVPQQYLTIQAAINASNNGDTILVSDGIYVENIRFMGKAIVVGSYFIIDGDTSHITQTIIDGSNPSHPDSASTVYFISGEDTTSVLCGFTIQGGAGTIWNSSTGTWRNGSGIFGNFALGATIKNNYITKNRITDTASGGGSGVFFYGGILLILEQNHIADNTIYTDGVGGGVGIGYMNVRIKGNTIIQDSVIGTTYAWGGGLYVEGVGGEIDGNLFLENYAASPNSESTLGGALTLAATNSNITNNVFESNTAALGGGIYVHSGAIPSFINNTIVNNIATSQGGGIRVNGTQAIVLNSIFWNNTPNQVTVTNGGIVEVNYSDIEGGWPGIGNINEYPIFMGPQFKLNPSSPCISTGTNSILINSTWYYSPSWDYEENHRPMPLETMPDMGAFEDQTSVIPVELVSFTYRCINGSVILSWSTATEINNMIFEIERRSDNSDFVLIGFVKGRGTTTEREEYSYTDKDVENGKYFYRLKQIDFAGSFEYSDEIEVEVNSPLTYAMKQNYPNPFNPSTRIIYSIPQKSFVSIKVYNPLGREIIQIVNEEKDPGTYEINFKSSGLASGLYFYSMKAGDFIETRKMILLK
jgi:hypothetical protein